MRSVVFAAFVALFVGHGFTEANELPEITNSIGMKLVLIRKGTFQMGSPPSEKGSEDDERQHEVTLAQDYYLGAFEVTQAQYEKVMGENPSHFQGDEEAERHRKMGRVVKKGNSCSNHPVDRVLWFEAVEFCERLSALPEEFKANRVYRLPTEAEWEYACRAGSKTAYSFGESSRSLGEYAWFGGNYRDQTHPVGTKKPNAWGLYDMYGNVKEWCNDYYPVHEDFRDPSEGDLQMPRVCRGGSWLEPAMACRSANRSQIAAAAAADRPRSASSCRTARVK